LIKINASKEEKEKLKMLFGSYRKCYNTSIDTYKTHFSDQDKLNKLNYRNVMFGYKSKIHPSIQKDDENITTINDISSLKNTPKSVKQPAVIEFVKNFNMFKKQFNEEKAIAKLNSKINYLKKQSSDITTPHVKEQIKKCKTRVTNCKTKINQLHNDLQGIKTEKRYTQKENMIIKENLKLLKAQKALSKQKKRLSNIPKHLSKAINKLNDKIEASKDHFLKYKTKKTKEQTINVEFVNGCTKLNGNRLMLFGKGVFENGLKMFIGRKRQKEKLNRWIAHPTDYKITKDRFNDYYLIITLKEDFQKEETFDSRPTCSIDPGIRTCYTVYDSENQQCYKIGNGTMDKIVKDYLIPIDKLKLVKGYKNKKKKYFRRLENLKSEFIHKISTYLTKKYSLIMIPRLKASEIVKKKQVGNSIAKITKRAFLSLGLTKILDQLKYKSKFTHSKILEVTEKYTTKTCGNCATLNNVQGAKEYNCSNCLLYLDRDCTASRSIELSNVVVIQ
jgi:transposase